ncbi:MULTISPECIES: ATP-grasp domain-containing protein [unclassified Streptomyces]|uniref:ATP-grasp domain-containing protein n=1 Tax=unclassified Streptomyces TaxID=2593676 RepID=UPI003B63DFFF
MLLTSTEPSWEKPHITDHAVVDLSDPAALPAAGRALAGRHDLAGVITWDEWSVVPTARLARQLGLPTTAPEVMQGCRNKATARSLFARHGVPSAASVSVRTHQEAEAGADRIGYPVVLKPASHAGAIGLLRVDDRAQLTAAPFPLRVARLLTTAARPCRPGTRPGLGRLVLRPCGAGDRRGWGRWLRRSVRPAR